MVPALVREMEPAEREARSTQRCAVPRRRLGCALAPPQGPGPEDASPSPACSALLPTPCRALWGRGCLLSRLPGCQALLAGAGGALLCAQSPPGAEQRGGAWGASAPSTATADQAEPGPEWVGEPHRVRVVSLGGPHSARQPRSPSHPSAPSPAAFSPRRAPAAPYTSVRLEPARSVFPGALRRHCLPCARGNPALAARRGAAFPPPRSPCFKDEETEAQVNGFARG